MALGCLAIPSIFIGFFTKDMFVGLGTHFWGNSIHVQPENMNMFDAEFIAQFYKLLPVAFSLLGISLAFFFYEFQSKLLFQLKISFFIKKIYNFLNKKWFFDKIYNEWLSQFFFKFGYSISYKIVDRGIFEMLGPSGLSMTILKISRSLDKLQTGYLYHYTFLILIGSTILLGIRQFWLVFGVNIDYRMGIIFFVFSFFMNSALKKYN
jgi:NADH-ubiquinone oxidoreductase chain 5